eukprot:11659657-Alexandrium_andersonii.AAC.1
MADGVWTRSTLRHLEGEASAVCQRCGSGDETTTHLWWECVRFSHIRNRIWPDGVPDPNVLPE